VTDSVHTVTATGIAYADTGLRTDVAVVCIHGSLDRMAGMAHVSRLIQREIRVIRYDRRGYGRSQPHMGPFRVADHVMDLLEVIDAAKDVDRIILIGHSFGGHVALAGSIALQERVVGVSIYESPLSWMSWWPGTTAGNMAVASDPATAAEVFMRRLVGDAKWESLPQATQDARRREGTALTAELSALREHAPYEFDKITVPVLCGFGERGAERHRKGSEYVAEKVNGRSVMIPGAGHAAPTSHPHDYVDLLIKPHV
jgi:pimeloyl-ACP methyl ester carboxylesterase